MTKATLQQVFGANATRTSTTLTIVLADLTSTGADPAVVSPEGLLLAVNLKASETLTPAARAADNDRTVAVERGNPGVAYRGQTPWYQDSVVLTAQKTIDSAALDPDNY